MHRTQYPEFVPTQGISRRVLIRGSLALGAVTLLSACGGPSSVTATSQPAATTSSSSSGTTTATTSSAAAVVVPAPTATAAPTVAPSVGTTGSRKVTFQVATDQYMTPNFRKAGDEFLRLYNVAHPDKEATFIDANTTKVVAMVAGGTPTDGFLTSNSTDVSGLYSKGALLPVSNYLNQNQVADIKEKMVSAAWQASYWGGKLWSTTETNDGAQLIWNKELFQNAGIPGPPKTPQDLVAAAGALTKRGPDGKLTQLGLYTFTGGVDDGSSAAWTAMFGGQWFDAQKNQYIINDPRNIECYQLMLQIEKQQDGEAARTEFMKQFQHGTTDGMATGKIAMIYWGEDHPGAIQKASQLTYSNLDYACLPHSAEGYCGELKAGNSFMVLQGAKDPASAADFAYWEVINVSDPIVKAEFTPAVGADIPVLKSDLVPGSPNYVRLLKDQPYLKAWLDMSLSGSYYPPDYTPLADWKNGQLAMTLTSIYQGKVDVAAGLQQLQQATDVKWQAFLSQNPGFHVG